MNFLAHAYLSGEDEQLLVGNFIADFVKGRQALSQFSPGIARGIALHRQIDAFTDTHPIVNESKKRLRERYRHYAPVIVDVFYDHFLASKWSDFHPMPLEAFAPKVYGIIKRFDAVLPSAVRHMLPYMVNGNWLVSYSNVEGIRRALTGMSQRTPYESGMEHAVKDLVADYDSYLQEFTLFFPLLENHVKAFLATGEDGQERA